MTGATGRVYVERGQPVTVLIAYCARRVLDVNGDWLHFPITAMRHPAARSAATGIPDPDHGVASATWAA
ncbi:hypothetical protein [Streptomyces chartreusis]|uniref:hypothetical protein n=1 Tax=Streptomyces chartreusis TaxID=1969 RepID=UPI00342EDFBC